MKDICDISFTPVLHAEVLSIVSVIFSDFSCGAPVIPLHIPIHIITLVSCHPGPLGGVRNLQVINPTMTTLNVRWEPAEGKVREYKVVYAPAAGGAESMVGMVGMVGLSAYRSSKSHTLHQQGVPSLLPKNPPS